MPYFRRRRRKRREPMGEAQRRTLFKTVRFSPTEVKELEFRAHHFGEPPSTLLRKAALGLRVRARPNGPTYDAVYHLGRIGNNINQLARVANSTGRLDLERELLEVLEELRDQVRNLCPR